MSPIIPAALGALLLATATAITLPVSEDSFSTASGPAAATIRLSPTSGAAAALEISPRQKAFVRFEAGSLAGDLPAPEVGRALLMVYFPKVTRAGAVQLHPVSQDWAETGSASLPAPSFQATPIATIPAASVIAKQFVIIDVTDQVKAWLDAPASDFGFAFSGVGTAQVQLGAKEGPAAGYPAVLQIERHPRIGNDHLATGIDTTKIGNGSVDDSELAYLDGATSVLQPQINDLDTGLAGLRTGLDEMEAGLDATRTEIGGFQTYLNEVQTIVDDKVGKAGDTMNGPLVLPSNGLKVGSHQLAVAGGKVGIGTDAPTAALEVRGEVKLGAAGDLRATAGEESLRIVRGTILYENGTLSLVSGQGFSFAKSGTSDTAITFTTAFAAPPTITFVEELKPSSTASAGGMVLRNVSASGVVIEDSAYLSGNSVHFIAIGPR